MFDICRRAHCGFAEKDMCYISTALSDCEHTSLSGCGAAHSSQDVEPWPHVLAITDVAVVPLAVQEQQRHGNYMHTPACLHEKSSINPVLQPSLLTCLRQESCI